MKNFSLKMLALPVLIFSATTFSGSALAATSPKPKATCPISVECDDIGSCVKTLLKVMTPYVLTIGYFVHVEPDLKARFEKEPLQKGMLKLAEAFVGVWVLEKIKNHAKYVDSLFGKPFDFGTEEKEA